MLSVSFHHLLRDLQHINAVYVFGNVYSVHAASQPVVTMLFSLVLNFLLRFVVFCVLLSCHLNLHLHLNFEAFTCTLHIIMMFSARKYSTNWLYMEIVRSDMMITARYAWKYVRHNFWHCSNVIDAYDLYLTENATFCILVGFTDSICARKSNTCFAFLFQ